MSVPSDVVQPEETKPESPSQYTLEDLLKNIPSDTFEYSEEEIKKIKAKFKTYKEIKADMKDIKMDIKTDNEIMNGLFQEYFNESSTVGDEQRIEILKEFEYLVHQYDNALAFLSADGYAKIILPNLVNQTNLELRKNALLILGGIVQNNPNAKVNT